MSDNKNGAIKKSNKEKKIQIGSSVAEVSKELKTTQEKTIVDEAPLFPHEPGKCPNYGTNDTLELLKPIPNEVVEKQLDNVLDAVKTVDNLCDYQRCKARTSLMGQTCEHCKKRFCFKHVLPEVHGCGEAVKKEERKKFLHPKPAKTLREEQDLAQARKKLDAKLKDMQISRMQKSSGPPLQIKDKNKSNSSGTKRKGAK